MDPGAVPPDAVLLLDTTVYIDGMKQAGLPDAIQILLANHIVRHSALCVGELSLGFGRLDSSPPDTPRNRSAIAAVLDRLTPSSFVDLSLSGWARGPGSSPVRWRECKASHRIGATRCFLTRCRCL